MPSSSTQVVVKEIWQVTRICGDEVQLESMPSGFCPCSRCCCGKVEKLTEEAGKMNEIRRTLYEASFEDSYTTAVDGGARAGSSLESFGDGSSGFEDSRQEEFADDENSIGEPSPDSTRRPSSMEVEYPDSDTSSFVARAPRQKEASNSGKPMEPSDQKVPEAETDAVRARRSLSRCKALALNKSLSSTVLQASIVQKNTKFACTECDKKFVKRGNLNRHFKSHLPPAAPTRCTRARKAKAPSTEQQVPAAKATGQVQGYSCEICPKTIRNKGAMAIHMRGKAHLAAAAAAAQVDQVQASTEHVPPTDLRSHRSGETFVTDSDDEFSYTIYPTNPSSFWAIDRSGPSEASSSGSMTSGAQQDEPRDSIGNPPKRSKVEVPNTGVTYSGFRICLETLEDEQEGVDLGGNESRKDFPDVKEPNGSQDMSRSSASSHETSDEPTSPAASVASAELDEAQNSSSRYENSGRPAVANRPFECCACSSRFESAKARNRHIESHRGPNGQFTCDLCHGDSLRPFKQFAEYASHIMQLHRSPVFICPQCQRRFSTSARLQQHQRAAHPEQEAASRNAQVQQNPPRLIAATPARDRYKNLFQTCSWCSKKCRSSNSLQLHVEQMHSSEVSQQPSTSSATSASASPPAVSEVAQGPHPGKKAYPRRKSFQCSKCPMRLSSKLRLEQHKRIHSGERRFVCNTCPRRFSTKQGLQTHHRIHSGEQSYECSICQHRFSQRSSMVTHQLRIHPMNNNV